MSVVICALVAGTALLTRSSAPIIPLWPPNAVGLTALLLRPPNRRSALLCAILIGELAGLLLVGRPPLTAAVLAGCYGLELLICLVGVSPFERGRGDIRGVVGFVLTVCLAPVVPAMLAAAWFHTASGAPRAPVLIAWVLAESLGYIVLTPALFALGTRSLRAWKAGGWWRPLAVLGGLIAMDVVVFSQSTLPLLFLVFPVLLLVVFEMEIAGAAWGLLLTALIAGGFALEGRGPTAMISPSVPIQLLSVQVFLAAVALSIGPVALVLANRRRQSEELIRADRALRISEERYRFLAETARDLTLQMSPSGRIAFVTSSCRLLMGYDPEALIGRSAIRMVHKDDRRRVLSAVFAALGPEPASNSGAYQFRARHKDGRWIWLEGQPRLVYARDGSVAEIQDALRDITARKSLEQELVTARAEAEAAVEVKAEFLANMSHELRTPLTSVLGFSKLLRERTDLPVQAEAYVSRVYSGTQALLSTVNDILEFSKLESSQVQLHPRPVAIRELAGDALSLFILQAQHKSLSLQLTVDRSAPKTVMIDPDRLRQVLLNLIGNAVKFTERGGVTVTLSYSEGRLRGEVADTGPGIPDDRRGVLFQRFSQVDGSMTRAHGGTGLGLAICRGLLTQMGGSIELRSDHGGGARFCFDLLAPDVAAPIASHDAVAGAGAAGAVKQTACARMEPALHG